MKIADNKADACECEECKYCGKDGLCKFGLRDIGCFMMDKIVSEMSTDYIRAVNKGLSNGVKI